MYSVGTHISSLRGWADVVYCLWSRCKSVDSLTMRCLRTDMESLGRMRPYYTTEVLGVYIAIMKTKFAIKIYTTLIGLQES